MKQLIEDLISAMEYHVEQTRPIHSTTVALQAAREALKAMPTHLACDCYQGQVCHVCDPITPPAQPAPVQEPVAWMYPDDYERMLTSETFCTVYSVEVGSATRGESSVALYTTPPAQPAPVQEPLEYWNAVEGWVKIDEVREHFESVGCGTIYKNAGDGRVPLTAAQRTWTGLTDEERGQIINANFGTGLWSMAKDIEAKLKEKNT